VANAETEQEALGVLVVELLNCCHHLVRLVHPDVQDPRRNDDRLRCPEQLGGNVEYRLRAALWNPQGAKAELLEFSDCLAGLTAISGTELD
jgi:hypothetical protein